METKLTFKAFRSFLPYLTPWWSSSEKKIAWWSLAGLVVLSLTSVYVGVFFNEWSRDFYNALEKKDLAEFYRLLGVFGIILPLLLLDFCARQYLVSWASFRWRRWMTTQLQEKWLFSKSYYTVPLGSNSLDNPDQRISQDINAITSQTTSLFMLFFRDGINLITFSVILWGVSSTLAFPFQGETYQFPGLLLWAALFYSVAGLIFILRVGAPLVDLDRRQEKVEANFRYSLMRIFERREEVAALKGEAFEDQKLTASFKEITQNYYQILIRSVYINLFQNFYLNGSQFIPLFIAGPLYFSSVITFGVLMQIRGMFHQVEGSLSVIVLNFSSIANLIASMQRYVYFLDTIDALNPNHLSQKPSQRLSLKGGRILSPKGDQIASIPPIQLESGERKLIMGHSGAGKTSLMRVIAKLYPYHEMTGVCEIPEEMMFVPQRPYMPMASTLRECLAYPALTASDEELVPLMQICFLGHLIPMLDVFGDYQQSLSLGEQQRVNFVRVFLQKPQWLFMDEPTSQLNKEFEEVLCREVIERLPQTGILVITHRSLPFFDEVIHMNTSHRGV